MSIRRSRIFWAAGLGLLLLLLGAILAATYWAVGPAVRCDLPLGDQVSPGWSARTLVSSNVQRCYYLYVPPGYDPARPPPVVVSFHGFSSNPASQALISGWHRLAEQEGFLVVYPQGTDFPQRWNAGAAWGELDVNDVQFFRDILDDLASVEPVDLSRVYISGFSNGGGMAVRIACEASGEVAAIGSVAGAVVDLRDCNPLRPVPIIAFHGTADPIVPYEGGMLRGSFLHDAAGATRAPNFFVGAEDWVATWAEWNGCDSQQAVISPQGDVRVTRYTGCDQNATVILYTIEGGGHTWPGGWPIPAVGATSREIDATEEQWQFFQRYTLAGLGR